MKKTTFVFAILALVFTARVAQAQSQQPIPPVNSTVVGVDFAPGQWVHAKGLLMPVGSIHSSSGDKVVGGGTKNDPWIVAYVGHKPLKHFGGEVRFMNFGAHGDSSGTVTQTEGSISTWGVNATPKIVSSAPILNGSVDYTQKSSVKISRFDLLVNYTFELPAGWISVFGGVPILRVESSEELTRTQGFLLYTLNPDRSVSKDAIREDYIYSSTAGMKSTHIGLTGGIEGAHCLVGPLSIEGRIAFATFPWGSGANLSGQFKANKDVYLVAAAGGVAGTPTQTLAHLNLAPASMAYSEKAKGTITAVDLKAGLKWLINVGDHQSLYLGASISRSSLNNLPMSAGYAISDPYAVGSGSFKSRTTNVSVWAPMLTVSMWF